MHKNFSVSTSVALKSEVGIISYAAQYQMKAGLD